MKCQIKLFRVRQILNPKISAIKFEKTVKKPYNNGGANE